MNEERRDYVSKTAEEDIDLFSQLQTIIANLESIHQAQNLKKKQLKATLKQQITNSYRTQSLGDLNNYR